MKVNNQYFRCQECHKEYRTSQEVSKNTCRSCSTKTQNATCQTWFFPIYWTNERKFHRGDYGGWRKDNKTKVY